MRCQAHVFQRRQARKDIDDLERAADPEVGDAVHGQEGDVTALEEDPAAGRFDAAADQGHSLQIVQAAGEEFMAWPAALADTHIDAFLHVAMRAAASGKRNNLV